MGECARRSSTPENWRPVRPPSNGGLSLGDDGTRMRFPPAGPSRRSFWQGCVNRELRLTRIEHSGRHRRTAHQIKSESQPTTAISTNGSTILAINGAMSSKLVIACCARAQGSMVGGSAQRVHRLDLGIRVNARPSQGELCHFAVPHASCSAAHRK
jgi:hypothetical protein